MKFAYCLTTNNLALYLLLAANSMMTVAAEGVAGADTTANETAKANRDLQSSCASTAAYHPDYSLLWNQGKCDLTITCDSPSYATELACCKTEYARQESGYCISQLVYSTHYKKSYEKGRTGHLVPRLLTSVERREMYQHCPQTQQC